MQDAAFDSVWQKVAGLEGATFHTSKGVSFAYRFHKTYVVVSAGQQSIPKTFFQKIFRRLAEGTAGSAPALQGQIYILAILNDERLREAGMRPAAAS